MSEPRTRSPRKTAATIPTSESTLTGVGETAEAAERVPSHDEIAARAHEIAHGPDGGSAEENWLRAERELRSAATGGG
jgi:Protein of unknown function (DUF2934)